MEKVELISRMRLNSRNIEIVYEKYELRCWKRSVFTMLTAVCKLKKIKVVGTTPAAVVPKLASTKTRHKKKVQFRKLEYFFTVGSNFVNFLHFIFE